MGIAASSSSKAKAPSKARTAAVPRVKKEKEAELPLRRSSRFTRSAVDPSETPAQKRKREVRS